MQQHSGGARPASGGIEDFEWINAWASQATIYCVSRHFESSAQHESGQASVHLLASAFAADAGRAAHAIEEQEEGPDLLANDIAAIRSARDALLEKTELEPTGSIARISAAGRAVLLRRTADSVPILLGTVIGGLMLIVFSVAATFVTFGR